VALAAAPARRQPWRASRIAADGIITLHLVRRPERGKITKLIVFRRRANQPTEHHLDISNRLKLVQDSSSLLRVLFWRDLPIGEQPIDGRKSLLHGLL
jgi:hypothetical protein